MTKRPPRQSWEGLRQREPEPIEFTGADTAEEIVMRAMTSSAGKSFMAWLRSETVDRRSPKSASDADLRWDEAQRALCARIETMCERGLTIAAERAKTKKS